MSATAVVVSATASTTVAVTTTTTRQVLHHVVYLFLRGFTVLQYGTLKIECLACQWVVEVHLHFVLADFHHATIEAFALLVLQGHDSILINMLVVEVSVDAEHLAVEVEHQLIVILSITLLLAQCEFEVLTLSGSFHLLFELVESKAKAGDE